MGFNLQKYKKYVNKMLNNFKCYFMYKYIYFRLIIN